MPSPESLAILKQEEHSRWEEQLCLHEHVTSCLVAQNRAERQEEFARASKATDSNLFCFESLLSWLHTHPHSSSSHLRQHPASTDTA